MPIKLLSLLMVMLLTPFHSAYALSCAPHDGKDQVLPILENAQTPLWFGKATLVSISDEPAEMHEPFSAVFRIDDTYMITDGSTIEEEVTISVHSFHRTWGAWIGTFSEKPPLKAGDTGQYFFAKGDDGWSFGGPGACTYISEQEWKQLEDGYYKDKVQLNGKEETDAD